MHTPRLMAVLAHPDDESLGVGGTLANYASDGGRVCLLHATRGGGGGGPRVCVRRRRGGDGVACRIEAVLHRMAAIDVGRLRGSVQEIVLHGGRRRTAGDAVA